MVVLVVRLAWFRSPCAIHIINQLSINKKKNNLLLKGKNNMNVTLLHMTMLL